MTLHLNWDEANILKRELSGRITVLRSIHEPGAEKYWDDQIKIMQSILTKMESGGTGLGLETARHSKD